MFSPQISHFWTENTFFLILFSRREGVGNTNLSIFPVPLIQLSPIFVHMVLVSHPTYPAKNFLIESPLVYFLVCVLIKITILVEISSWAGQRELPIRLNLTQGSCSLFVTGVYKVHVEIEEARVGPNIKFY